MRKLLVLIFVVFAFTFSNDVKAQQESGQVVLSAGAGYSVISKLLSVGENVQSIPPLYLNADYGITNNLSIGLAGSYSSISYDDVLISTDDMGNIIEEDVNVQGSRNTVAARVLFHFGDNPKLDQYAGLRAGMTFWGWNDESLVDEENLSANNLSYRILYGMRAYLTDNLGVNLEIGIGSPYFFNGGISYRL